MQRIITLLIFATFSNFVVAQTNYERFKTLYNKNDTTKIKSLLSDWERSDPNDPELYTSALNFYFTKRRLILKVFYKNMPSFGSGIIELIAVYARNKENEKANALVKVYKNNKKLNQETLNMLYILYPNLEK